MCPECNLPGDIAKIEYVNMKREEVIELTRRQPVRDNDSDSHGDSDSESDEEEPPKKKCSHFCIIN